VVITNFDFAVAFGSFDFPLLRRRSLCCHLHGKKRRTCTHANTFTETCAHLCTMTRSSVLGYVIVHNWCADRPAAALAAASSSAFRFISSRTLGSTGAALPLAAPPFAATPLAAPPFAAAPTLATRPPLAAPPFAACRERIQSHIPHQTVTALETSQSTLSMIDKHVPRLWLHHLWRGH
jgi:hypothetical protein